jgi:hypothetical protein
METCEIRVRVTWWGLLSYLATRVMFLCLGAMGASTLMHVWTPRAVFFGSVAAFVLLVSVRAVAEWQDREGDCGDADRF